jgi:hypothetical protein
VEQIQKLFNNTEILGIGKDYSAKLSRSVWADELVRIHTKTRDFEIGQISYWQNVKIIYQGTYPAFIILTK